MPMGKILVADDDKNICELIRLYLEKEGYAVVMAHDGEAAVEQFSAENPDLVLLDIMMPKLDGWQVCREIRKKSNTPIIMITDNPDTPLAKRATYIIRAISRDQAITGTEVAFSHSSINFVIELLFLFLTSCWDDPVEFNRIISKNLLGDRQYS